MRILRSLEDGVKMTEKEKRLHVLEESKELRKILHANKNENCLEGKATLCFNDLVTKEFNIYRYFIASDNIY